MGDFMFEGRTDANAFRRLIEAIKDLVTDANFNFNKDGLHMQAMDTSHVALIQLALFERAFTCFNFSKEFVIGMNLASLQKILKRTEEDDNFEIRLGHHDDKAHLALTNENVDRYTKYDMCLIDIDCEHMSIPSQDYDITIWMPSKMLETICKMVSDVGDTMEIRISDDDVVHFTSSGDSGTMSDKRRALPCKKAPPSDEEDDKVYMRRRNNTTMKLILSLKYMKLFTKATPLSHRVRLSVSEDTPLCVRYTVKFNAEEDQDDGQLEFYLAPKVDETDDATETATTTTDVSTPGGPSWSTTTTPKGPVHDSDDDEE